MTVLSRQQQLTAQFKALPTNIQADLNVRYAYEKLKRLPTTANITQVNQYVDAFNKTIATVQKKLARQNLIETLQIILNQYGTFEKMLSPNQRLTELYQLLTMHASTLSDAELKAKITRFETLFIHHLNHGKQQILHQTQDTLKALKELPLPLQRQAAVVQAHDELNQALLSGDYLQIQKKLVLITNVLLIVRSTKQLLPPLNIKKALPAPASIHKKPLGTAGLLTKNENLDSPLYFMKKLC